MAGTRCGGLGRTGAGLAHRWQGALRAAASTRFGLAALIALIITVASPLDAGAALDPRTIDPMELRLRDWLGLRDDDRQVLMTGFAIGWQGDKVPKKNPSKADSDEASQTLSLKITKLANSGKHGHARLATILTRARILGRLPLVRFTGANWLGLPVRHRLIMLHGIQSGQYCRKLWIKLGKPRDSATLEKALANGPVWEIQDNTLNPLLMLKAIATYSENRINAAAAALAKELADGGSMSGRRCPCLPEDWPFIEAVVAMTKKMVID